MAPVVPGAVVADAATAFASLGLLDAATPLLEDAGWDGTFAHPGTGPIDPSAYPRSLGARDRRALGVHYTPEPLARALTDRCLGTASDPRIGDPACGAGAFLVAAAVALRKRGAPVERIVGSQLFGADVDPSAVALARLAVARWAAEATGRFHPVPDDHLVVADALGGTDRGDRWVDTTGVVDVVVGNPPFGSQLRGAAVRSRADRARVATLLGEPALGYADTASLFLRRAVDLVADQGRIALILPASVAASRDAASVRADVAARTRLTAVWTGGHDVGFDAAVSVWAPLLEKRQPAAGVTSLTRYHGRRLGRSDTIDFDPWAPTWAAVLSRDPVVTRAAARLVAAPGRERSATVDSVATVVAGFRRHFYGLAPHVAEAPGTGAWAPCLVTTGAIDPLHHRTDVPVRFAGRSLARPMLDLGSLEEADPALAAWVRSMLVPKVLVASQGRVPEAIVDPDGTLVPSTPVIAVIPRAATTPTLWHLVAVVLAPAAALLLRATATGTGLDGRGCRVSAGFVAGLTLPTPGTDWDEAADAACAATGAAAIGDATGWNTQLDRLGTAMARAATIGVGGRGDGDPFDAGELLAWWGEQRPHWRGARLLNR